MFFEEGKEVEGREEEVFQKFCSARLGHTCKLRLEWKLKNLMFSVTKLHKATAAESDEDLRSLELRDEMKTSCLSCWKVQRKQKARWVFLNLRSLPSATERIKRIQKFTKDSRLVHTCKLRLEWKLKNLTFSVTKLATNTKLQQQQQLTKSLETFYIISTTTSS